MEVADCIVVSNAIWIFEGCREKALRPDLAGEVGRSVFFFGSDQDELA